MELGPSVRAACAGRSTKWSEKTLRNFMKKIYEI